MKMSIFKDGRQITTLEEWREFGGPKRADQWKKDRSAMELARRWLGGFPNEVTAAICHHDNFGDINHWTAVPEVPLRFDNFKGEPRNSDLVVQAEDKFGSYVIAVEGKADESFGDLLGEAFASAMEAKLKNSRSNSLARIQALSIAFLHEKQPGEPSAKQIRYQLLAACAGVIAEAQRRKADRALMLIHEFKTKLTTGKNLERNQIDLNNFIRRISRGKIGELNSGGIVGPFELPSDSAFPKNVRLFIGKVSTDLRDHSS